MPSLAFNATNYWVCLGTFIKAGNEDILQGLEIKSKIELHVKECCSRNQTKNLHYANHDLLTKVASELQQLSL